MGSTAEMCGFTASPKPVKKTASRQKKVEPVERIKQAFSGAYNQGFEDQVKRMKFLLEASGQKMKKAEDILPDEIVPDDVIEDDLGEEEIVDDAMAEESLGQGDLADQLIEKLLATIEDPTLANDEDRESVLESANTFEDEELKEGKKTASVNELVEARMQQYFDLLGQEG